MQSAFDRQSSLKIDTSQAVQSNLDLVKRCNPEGKEELVLCQLGRSRGILLVPRLNDRIGALHRSVLTSVSIDVVSMDRE